MNAPIIDLVVPDGVIRTESIGNDLWGVPTGVSGSEDNPIDVNDVRAFTVRVGLDPAKGIAGTEPGGPNVAGFNPMTLRHYGPSVQQFGSNGPKPSVQVTHFESWPTGVKQRLVMSVSLVVDQRQSDFDQSYRKLVAVWFIKSAEEQPEEPEPEPPLEEPEPPEEEPEDPPIPDETPLTGEWSERFLRRLDKALAESESFTELVQNWEHTTD